MNHNVTSCEQPLIGALLASGADVMPILLKAGVKAEWFDKREHAAIYAAACARWMKNENSIAPELILEDVNRQTLVKASPYCGVETSIAYLCECIDAGGYVGAVESYVAELRETYLKRAFRKEVQAACKKIDTIEVRIVAAELTIRLERLVAQDEEHATATLGEQIDESTNAMKKAHQIYMVEKRRDYVDGLILPWWHMTFSYYGLPPGLNILAARPSVGKTSFCINLVSFWLSRGMHVLFDSLDMGVKPLIDRFLISEARVALGKTRFGYTSSADLATIVAAADKVREQYLTVREIDDVDALYALAKVMKAISGLDVIVVDFIQLMTYEGATKDTDEGRIARISRTLKRIGNALHIPVVALSQLNRKCEEDGGREPTVSDLRGSGSLEQDATTVTILHRRTEVLDGWKEERAKDMFHSTPMRLACDNAHMMDAIDAIELILAKNQNGRTARIPFVVYKNYFVWMLADYQKEAEYKTVGVGAAAKKRRDVSEQFKRVHADGRNKAFEELLRLQCVLLPEELPPAPADEPQAVDTSAPSAPVLAVSPAASPVPDGTPDYDDLTDDAEDEPF